MEDFADRRSGNLPGNGDFVDRRKGERRSGNPGVTPLIERRAENLAKSFRRAGDRLSEFSPMHEGRLIKVVGERLEAVGCDGGIGSRYQIQSAHSRVDAEVVGFSGSVSLLMAESPLNSIAPGAIVVPKLSGDRMAVGDELIGRVLDGSGAFIDRLPPAVLPDRVSIRGESRNPLDRLPVTQMLDVGVRAINACTTVGKGQRIGLFAGSGVGKTTLMGMMTRHTDADVVVIAMVGERGKEVREFIENVLGPEGLRKSVVVATPADDPPLRRIRGAWRATAVAEYFRGRGKNVLLLMDSLTRFAQAQREIGLAIGEPPVTRGYTPSVFSALPSLVERAGNGSEDEGSITAVYTVLTEGDDPNDPIADSARSFLDGHIQLSRENAESGIYPAIDLESSVSRSMNAVASELHVRAAQSIRRLYSHFRKNKDLISVGAYREGSDQELDIAIRAWPRICDFISQIEAEPVSISQSVAEMQILLSAAAGVADAGASAAGVSETTASAVNGALSE